MNLPEFHTQHVFFAYASEQDHLLFRQVVSDMPYLVHLSTAANSDDTLKSLRQFAEPPDLVILDLELRDLDGLECLHEIKRIKKLASLPVVIYAPTSFPATINQLYEGGAHLYIHKTLKAPLFKRTVQHVLSINWKEKMARPPRDEFVLRF